MQAQTKRRQYQPRTSRASQITTAAMRQAAQCTVRAADSHSLDRSVSASKLQQHSSSSRHSSDSLESSSTTLASGSARGVASEDPSQSGTAAASLPAPQSQFRVRAKSQVIPDDVPLPTSKDSINDFTVLPSSHKKVLQTFVFARLERPDSSVARRFVLGPQMEWKRRFMRVVCLTSGKERLEIYRTERRKGEHPMVKELVYSFPLEALQHVHPQYVEQEHQLQFEHFDYESKRVTQEYVYGHIRIVLDFQNGEVPSMELCCTSSAERDEWVEFFVSYICKRERNELLCYTPPLMPMVRMQLCPMEGVQKYTSMFLSGARNSDEPKKKDEAGSGFGNNDVDPISKTERTVSALKWDVLIATSIINRLKFTVECARVGILTVVGRGEFAVSTAKTDVASPDVFYVKPEDPSVAAALQFYLNDDKMFEIRTLAESKKFRVWLHQCFGLHRDQMMRSFHSPHGADIVNRNHRNRSGEGSNASHHGMRSTSPVDDVANASSPPLPASGIDEGVPFFQSTFEKRGGKEGPGTLRRMQSVVLQKRKLESILHRAILDPSTFAWNEMASTAFVEYNLIGVMPKSDSCFAERIVALDAESKRFFVLSLPPLDAVILDIAIADITYVTGYSEIYGGSGFTFHLFGVGLEIHVVPTRDEARRLWTVALRSSMSSECLLKGKCREETNSRYLLGASDLYVDSGAMSYIVAAASLCSLCGEKKHGVPQCRVSGLPHVEYARHAEESRTALGSTLGALPARVIRCSTDVQDVLRRSREAIRACEAFERSLDAADQVSPERTT